MDFSQALDFFEKMVRELERKRETEKRLEKERHKQDKRKLKNEFRSLLYDYIKCEKMTINSSWREIKAQLANEEAFKDFTDEFILFILYYFRIDTKGIFKELMKELEKKYKHQKKGLKRLAHFYKIKITPELTTQDFINIISVYHHEINDISRTNISVFLEEALEKQKKKEMKKERRKEKKEENKEKEKEQLEK